MAGFERHVFVCTNERDESAARPSCRPKGAKALKDEFKEAIKDAGLKHRVRGKRLGAWINASTGRWWWCIRRRSGTGLCGSLMSGRLCGST